MAIADAYVDLHINGDHISGEIRRAVKKAAPDFVRDAGKVGDKAGKELGQSLEKQLSKIPPIEWKSGPPFGAGWSKQIQQAVKARERAEAQIVKARERTEAQAIKSFERETKAFERRAAQAVKVKEREAAQIRKIRERDEAHALKSLERVGEAGDGGGLSRRAKLWTAIGVSAIATSPHILALAGSLLEVAKVGALLPAAFSAAAAGVATLAVGFRGFGQALKDMDDPKKFAESLKNLAPNAQATAKAIKSISPAWQILRKQVQQNLFEGFAQNIRALSSTYLPVLRRGMMDMATQFSAGFGILARGLRQTDTVSSIGTIFKNTAKSLEPFFAGLTSIIRALIKVADVGSGFLPGLALSFEKIGAQFKAFIDQAAQSGALQQFIQDGIEATKQLFNILKSVWQILGGIIGAAQAAGGGGLANLATVLGGIADVVNGPAFQQGLTAFFSGLVAGLDGVMGALPAVGDLLATLGPIVGDLAAKLGPILGEALTSVAHAFEDFAPLVGTIVSGLASFIGLIAPAAGPLLVFTGIVIGMVKAFIFVTKAIKIVRTAWLLTQAAFLFSPIGFIITVIVGAIALLVAGVIMLWKRSETFRKIVTAAWEAVKDAAMAAFDWIKGHWKLLLLILVAPFSLALIAIVVVVRKFWPKIKSILMSGVNWLKSNWKTLLIGLLTAPFGLVVVGAVLLFKKFGPDLVAGFKEGFQNAWDAIPEWLKGLITGFIDMIKSLFGISSPSTVLADIGKWVILGLLQGLQNTWNAVVTFVSGVMGTLGGLFVAGWNFIVSSISNALGLVYNIFVTGWNAVMGFVGSVLGTIANIIRTGLNYAVSFVRSILSGIGGFFKRAWDGAVAILRGAITRIQQIMPFIVRAITKPITDLIGGIKKIGGDIVQGLVDGIKGGFRWVEDAAKELTSRIPGPIKDILRIGSPSRLMMEYGQNVGDGLAIGMDNSQGVVAKSAENLALASIESLKATFAANQKQINDLLGPEGTNMSRGIAAQTTRLAADNKKIQAAIKSRTRRASSSYTPSYTPRSTGGGGGSSSTTRRSAAQTAADKAKKTLLEIGQDLGRSMILGLTGTEKQVAAAITRLNKLVIKGFTTKLGTRKGTAAAEAFIKRNATLNKKLLKSAKDRAAALSAYTKYKKETVDPLKALVDKTRSDLMQFGSFTSIEDAANATTSSLVENLNSRLAKIKQFGQSLLALRKAGLNDTTIGEIIAAGPEAGNQLALKLLEGGKGVINEVNQVTSQIKTQAGTVADQAGQAMFGVGVKAADGLLAGLKSKSDKLNAAATKLANDLVKAVKKALGIKSPSVIMAKQGDMAVAGFVNSIAAGQRAAAAAGQALGASAVPAIGRARTGGVQAIPRTSTVNNGAMTVNMTVSVDDLNKMSKVGDFMVMLENARMNQRRRIGTVNG